MRSVALLAALLIAATLGLTLAVPPAAAPVSWRPLPRPAEELVNEDLQLLAGEDPTGGALYFWSRDDGWIGTRPVVARIGGHAFAR